jgi:hypothetical protein
VPGWARHEGYQSKPGTVQYRVGSGRLTWPRLDTIILTRIVSGRRHDGPIGPEPVNKKKHSKIQNLKIIFKFILDSINYIYNFRYILRQRNSDTHINTYHNFRMLSYNNISSIL